MTKSTVNQSKNFFELNFDQLKIFFKEDIGLEQKKISMRATNSHASLLTLFG